jgi:hypothetical protein
VSRPVVRVRLNDLLEHGARLRVFPFVQHSLAASERPFEFLDLLFPPLQFLKFLDEFRGFLPLAFALPGLPHRVIDLRRVGIQSGCAFEMSNRLIDLRKGQTDGAEFLKILRRFYSAWVSDGDRTSCQIGGVA